MEPHYYITVYISVLPAKQVASTATTMAATSSFTSIGPVFGNLQWRPNILMLISKSEKNDGRKVLVSLVGHDNPAHSTWRKWFLFLDQQSVRDASFLGRQTVPIWPLVEKGYVGFSVYWAHATQVCFALCLAGRGRPAGPGLPVRPTEPVCLQKIQVWWVPLIQDRETGETATHFRQFYKLTWSPVESTVTAATYTVTSHLSFVCVCIQCVRRCVCLVSGESCGRVRLWWSTETTACVTAGSAAAASTRRAASTCSAPPASTAPPTVNR